MKKEHERPQRKPMRLKNYDYSTPGGYFITICTADRKNCFWSGLADKQEFHWQAVGANCVRPYGLPLSPWGEVIANELEKWHNTYKAVSLHSYVIMPNHLHVMLVISADENGRSQNAPTVSRMVKQFKGAVTKRIGIPLWQKSFMEHIIRDQTDYDVRANYLYENPFRWQEDELYTS